MGPTYQRDQGIKDDFSGMLAEIPVTDSNGGRVYVSADAILLAAADLFAGNPHLAQHLVDLCLSHETSSERFSPFLHLFEIATGPTGCGGAKDYRFGYRLRTFEQRESAEGALSKNEVTLSGHDSPLTQVVSNA